MLFPLSEFSTRPRRPDRACRVGALGLDLVLSRPRMTSGARTLEEMEETRNPTYVGLPPTKDALTPQGHDLAVAVHGCPCHEERRGAYLAHKRCPCCAPFASGMPTFPSRQSRRQLVQDVRRQRHVCG